MHLDPSNPVIALCVAGMQVEGDAARARALFEQAWAARVDDFDASVAAHFMARHQATPEDKLRWNDVALRHADALPDDRARELLPSLCLNLADSYLAMGRLDDARIVAARAVDTSGALPSGGYAEWVRSGITRLQERLRASDVELTP